MIDPEVTCSEEKGDPHVSRNLSRGSVKAVVYSKETFTEDKGGSTSIKKIFQGIHSNRGIMTVKVPKILIQVPNNSCVVIVFIFWCIFRGRANVNNSSSANGISWIKNQRVVETLPLKIISVFITRFLPFVITWRRCR